MDVGAARVHRADPGDPAAVRPRRWLGGDPQGSVLALQQPVRRADAGRRRHDVNAQREHRLDQPGGAGRGFRVPDVSRDRADHRGLLRAAAQLREGGELGQVGRGGTRPVPLDQLDVHRVDARPPVGPAQREQLATGIRRGQDRVPGRGHPPAGDLGVDRQPGGAGIGGPHQHDHAEPYPGRNPVGLWS